MSRVDKKPTYKGRSAVTLASWCKMHEEPDLMEKYFGDGEKDAIRAIITARQLNYGSIEYSDIIAGVDKTMVYATTRAVDKRHTTRQYIARDFLRAVAESTEKMLFDSPAAVYVANECKDVALWPLDYETAQNAIANASDTATVVADDAMHDGIYFKTVGRVLGTKQILVTHLAAVNAVRKAFTSTASKDVFEAWVAINLPGRYDSAHDVQAAKAPEDRYLVTDHPLRAHGFRVHYVTGVTIAVKNGIACIFDKEGRDKARKMITSMYQAVIYSAILDEVAEGHPSSTMIGTQVGRLIAGAANEVEKGGSSASIVKALSKWHMGLFQSMPEASDPKNTLATEYAGVLFEEAKSHWSGVENWIQAFGNIPVYVAMEMCKLGGIICPDDGDPAAFAGRLAKQQENPRKADTDVWADFMKFVKAYDVAQEIFRKGVVPLTEGIIVDGEWVSRNKNGMFCMPPREEWGKFWIKGYYDDADTTPYEWLDAQDVTWLGPYADKVLTISNELVEAWANGPRIDRERLGPEAADFSLVHGAVMYWAGKAEGSKKPEDQRLTASSDAGSRALFSSFENAERAHTDVTPGFGQNLSPFQLCDKMNEIAARSESAPFSIASSHDVKGWSEFEDRGCKNEYLAYEAGKFSDPMIAKSNKIWDNVTSVFRRMGHNYEGPFEHGGVQGLNGGADTLYHAKIIAYVHQRGIEKGLIRGSANALTCIDDVLYNPNTSIGDYVKRARKVREHISSIYDALAYPLDPTKSIMGIMKYVFLNDAYSDKALIASPIRVAYKMDIDETMMIRDVVSDTSAMMATASATAVAQAPAHVAYLHGLINVYNYLLGFFDRYVPATVEQRTVWSIAPCGEGGLGIPTYREFMSGSDQDRSFTWRDAISRSNYSNVSHATALAAMSGHAIVSVSATSSFRDPFQIAHDIPSRGEEVRKYLVEKVMEYTPHASEWDSLRAAGTGAVDALVKAIVASGGVIDASISGDIAASFPDTLYDGIVARFSTGSALKGIARPKTVYKVARAVARADRKWMQHMKEVCALTGYAAISNPMDTCYELRNIVHAGVICVNNVIPSARACIAFQGSFPPGESVDMDFVAVDSAKIRPYGGRHRQDQMGCTMGRKVGTSSSAINMDDVGRILKRTPVGSKIVKYAILVSTARSMGYGTDAMCTAYEKAWDLPYAIDSLSIVDGKASLKRVSGVMGRRNNLALANRHVYAAATCRTDGLMNFASAMTDHSLLNAMMVSHHAKMCALSASAIVGAETSSYAKISWGIRPAADIAWEFVVHPAAFLVDPDLDMNIQPFRSEIFSVPKAIDIKNAAALVGAKVSPTAFAVSHAPAVQPVAIYKIKVELPEIGFSRPKRTIIPVRRDNPVNAHGRNLIVTSVVKTRVTEMLRNKKVDIERAIWGDDDFKVPMPVDTIDKIYSDVHVILGDAHGEVGAVLNYATRSTLYTGKSAAQVHSMLLTRPDDCRKIAKLAYDGVVGKSGDAYDASQRGLVVTRDPDGYNARHRLQTLVTRNSILVKRYKVLMGESRTAGESSYYQGRMFARMIADYDGEGVRRVDSARCNELFRSTADMSVTAYASYKQEIDNHMAVKMHNARIARARTSLNWVPDDFDSGYDKEVAFMDKDDEDIKDRVYAIAPGDIDKVTHDRPATWSVVAGRTEDMVAPPAPEGTAAAIEATVSTGGSGGAVVMDWLADIDLDESSEEETEGIVP